LSGDTARLLAASEVPEIRLSGLWLERVGFPKGNLLSADRSFATIYLQADIPKPIRKRR